MGITRHNSGPTLEVAARRWRDGLSLLLLLALLLSGCGQGGGSAPRPTQGTQEGLASFYGRGFHGKETSSGETFNKHEMVAAHPSHPSGTRVRVTSLENGRAAEVRIIDRGPTAENQAEGVIIDLSEGAATELGIKQQGRARVKVEVLEWGSGERKQQ